MFTLTLAEMKINHVGECVFSTDDLFDLIMQGHAIASYNGMIVDADVNIDDMIQSLDDPGQISSWRAPTDESVSIGEFDRQQQNDWYMPLHYRELDIAEHVLGLCQGDAELQRAGQELLMFQERGMFDLLRYLAYLVDVMRENNVIWGVGRGSSVASFVLYKLGVHRVNSLYYDLDPAEFLR